MAVLELLPGGKMFSLQLPLVSRLENVSRALLWSVDGKAADFSRPPGEPALASPASVSWRIFKNPVSLFIGGVAAVILELAEPRVRTGVWEHSGFRKDPVRRLKRTGLAAMITVYGARSTAESMIAGVRRMHEHVRGATPAGKAYAANDPELLNWVHATAAFGFLEAYHAYVSPLSEADRGRYYCEGGAAAALYGVTRKPGSAAEINALFEDMHGRLEPSAIVFEFLDIMRQAPIFPPVLRLSQPLLVRAAIDITPSWVREILELPSGPCLRDWEALFVKRAGAAAERIMLPSSPAVQSCLRLGLPADYLYGAGADGVTKRG
jgi:uncharacterized protein (DUF2236 family)